MSSVFKDLDPYMGFGGGRGSKSGWRCLVLTGFQRAIPDYLAVNGTTHAVM